MNWLLLKNSLLVAGGATLLAAGIGTAAATFMCGAGERLRKGVFMAAILSLAMPPFLTVNCWLHYLGGAGAWRAWLPLELNSPAGAALLLALMTWPVTALAINGALQRLEPSMLEADPAVRGWPLMRGVLFPMARTALLRAALITFVLALNNFTIPAILQVKVYPAEVWVLFNTELNAGEAFAMSWPMILAPLAVLLWLARGDIAWPNVSEPVSGPLFRRQIGRVWHGLSGLVTLPICLLSAGLPLWQIASVKRTWTELPGALAAGGSAAWNSFWLPAAAATVVAGGTLVILVAGRKTEDRGRRAEDRGRRASFPYFVLRIPGAALLWLPFFTPGVLLGIGLILLFNRPSFEAFYQSFGVVLLALVVRYAAVGGWGVARAMRMTDRDLTDAARMEGASCWRMLWQVWWPQIGSQVRAAWYVVYLLCLWDVESVVMIVPPGGETLALRIFNLLHYGHNAQVNALCLTLLILAILPLLAGKGIIVLVKIARRFSRKAESGAMVLGIAVVLSGCSPSSSSHEGRIESRIFSSARIIGTRGAGPGQFNKPRSVVTDRAGNLYAVDMTGRVQKYSPDGEYLLAWQMPQTDLGRPKGLACDHEGNVVVLEPHYHRVNHFSTNGVLVGLWGSHGTNEGEFSFPRAVAVNSRGEIWTSEYGLVERIQKFAVDPVKAGGTDGTNSIQARLLLAVGSPGMDPGQFNRPEGLCVDAQDRLYVADSCNHRVQVFDNAGRFLRQFGRPGRGKGELSYPYDVAVDKEGRCYVCEFGNHRVQVFDTNGASLEILGVAGAAPGQFANPWGLALDSSGNLYVADSQNHRVQKLIHR